MTKKTYKDRLKASESLAKGQNGDWEKEGYKISHQNYGDGIFHVHMRSPSGELVGIHQYLIKPKGLSVKLSDVDFPHRRKGIATASHQYAEKIMGKKVTPSKDQTENAKQVWAQPNRPFGKSQPLQKSPMVNEAIRLEDMPEVASEIEGKMNKRNFNHEATHKIGDKYHHIFVKKYKYQPNINYHFLSPSADPQDHDKFLAEINTTPITPDDLLSHHQGYLRGWHDPHMVVYSKARKQGQGHGKQLYNSVLAHHGMLLSDQQVSPGGDKQYRNNFAKEPHINTSLTNKPHENHVVAVDDKDAFDKHVGFEPNIDQERKHKMAKSEGLEKAKVGYRNLRTAENRGPFFRGKLLGTHLVDGHLIHHYSEGIKEDPSSFFVKHENDDPSKPAIGSLTINSFEGKSPEVEHSGVVKEHQKKGIGSAIYKAAINNFGRLNSSNNLSPASDATWKKLSRDGEVNVIISKKRSDPHSAAKVINSNAEHFGKSSTTKLVSDYRSRLEKCKTYVDGDSKNYAEGLEKGRGQIELPNLLPANQSRPDQEIMTIDTDRQKKIAAAKAGNAKMQTVSNNPSLRDIVGQEAKENTKNLVDNLGHEKHVQANVKAFKNHYNTEISPETFMSEGALINYTGQKPIGVVTNEGAAPSSVRRGHEAIHYMMANVQNKHGREKHNEVLNHLNNHIQDQDKAKIGQYLKTIGYTNTSIHPEEYLSHVHELLHDKNVRNQFQILTGTSDSDMKDMSTRLKRSWHNILKTAKDLK